VVLIAVWGVVQGWRSRGPFGVEERRWIKFWLGAALVSLLLAFGRHAPAYQLVYPLPFFSSIRNPIKFMHAFHLALLILFAYGLLGLGRAYVARGAVVAGGWLEQFRLWWRQPRTFEHTWVKWMLGWVAASLLAWIIFGSSRTNLVRHLQAAGFGPAEANATFSFVAGELGWYLLFLGVGGVVLAFLVSGVLGGERFGRWAWFSLGLCITLDLARANVPWIVYQDDRHKYASNPIIEFLGREPYEHRVQIVPFQGGPALGQLQEIYGLEWLQHLFPYNDIQSLDLVMEPRVAADNQAYRAAFVSPDMSRNVRLLVRKWELTNTRYLLGLGGEFADRLNDQLDPERRRFRLHTAFNLVAKREPVESYVDVTATLQTNGAFGLIEFTGALPRASLFGHWRVVTNDTDTLNLLTDPEFDPERTVVLNTPIDDAAVGSATNSPGTVSFEGYRPKRIELKTRADSESVLLLNDKFHPAWQVTVDGEQAELLRCNFLMRGVKVPAGEHRVVFAYRPPTGALYLSLLGIVLGLGLCGVLVATGRPSQGRGRE